ncbi:MAG: thiamine-phosphate pyrophosphorylase, partial [Legionellales bacterium]|nr:thiamine-phosphate pyrophosphorylase [Legionellales bacterium]
MALVNNNILPGRKYIIDANINRFKEGARVIEDIARFVLRDQNLFIKIRNLRHTVTLENIYRSSNNDLGGSNFKESNQRDSLLDIANANCIRMQEAS